MRIKLRSLLRFIGFVAIVAYLVVRSNLMYKMVDDRLDVPEMLKPFLEEGTEQNAGTL